MDPELSLGVEVRDTWDENEELSLIQTLSDTNFRKRARNLCLVTPDDLSDAKFLKLREVEKRGVIENLSVIRVGDFANYLDALIETATATNNNGGIKKVILRESIYRFHPIVFFLCIRHHPNIPLPLPHHFSTTLSLLPTEHLDQKKLLVHGFHFQKT